METNKFYNQIEDFLTGNLSDSDSKNFESEMSTNSELANAVSQYETAFEAVDLLVEEGLKMKLKALQKERYSEVKVLKPKRKMWAIAASVAILISVGFSFLMNQNYSNQSLAAGYFETFDDGIRGGETGLKAFNEGNYDLAIEELKTVPETDQKYIESQFYLGQSYFKTNQFKEAIISFETVFESNDGRFKNAAFWFSGLSYLGNNQVENAQSIFEQIKNQNAPPYSEKAENLLNSLESFWRF